LKTVFNGSWKTSEVLIEGLAHIIEISLELAFNQVADREENHCYVEACKSCFEANFISRLLKNNFFALVLFISVIELRDLFDDPECLSVKLLFQVGIKNIR
jgi:hypothetical protein